MATTNSFERARELFETDRLGDTIIVTPKSDLCEFEFEPTDLWRSEKVRLAGHNHVKNVIFDFRNTDYFGSTVLGFFVKLWQQLRSRGGELVFCNVSEHEKEILHVTNLDHLWPICVSLEEALEKVAPSRPRKGRQTPL